MKLRKDIFWVRYRVMITAEYTLHATSEVDLSLWSLAICMQVVTNSQTHEDLCEFLSVSLMLYGSNDAVSFKASSTDNFE